MATINDKIAGKCMKCEPFNVKSLEECSTMLCGYTRTHDKGRKDDKGKLMLAQFYKHFSNAYKAMVDCAMYGFHKYNEDIKNPNWKKNNIEQYEDALFRHFDKYLTGEKIDDESKKEHLAHIIWNSCVLYELNRGL